MKLRPGGRMRAEWGRHDFESFVACLRFVQARHFGGIASLRSVWTRLLLRPVARKLLAEHGLQPPADALLFQLDPEEKDLEHRFTTEEAWSAAREAASSGLVRICEQRSSDLAHRLGAAFEFLGNLELDTRGEGLSIVGAGRNKRTGTFYTPAAVAREVARRALDEFARVRGPELAPLWVCDPACGSGAFLLEFTRELWLRRQATATGDSSYEGVLRSSVCGIDLDPLAIAVCELCLWSAVGRSETPARGLVRLHAGDALTGRGFAERPYLAEPSALDLRAAFPDRIDDGFDLIIGNPPWVAFAGRAAQPLEPELRRFFARAYAGFRGYPTLQAAFVERALELAPRGIVALLVPSPIADLDGYRPIRRRLFTTHRPAEPLLEFGQDAFSEVTQPCFALVATPRAKSTGEPPPPSSNAPNDDRAWLLSERPRLAQSPAPLRIPDVLERLRDGPRLPAELFGEMGLQSTRLVTEHLFLRNSAPSGDFTYPLLEGKDVSEYRVGPVRLYLRPDPDLLARARCRLRAEQDYQRVALVVRQTARAPIAALHNGLPFRNSLLAGFRTDPWPADLLVGLLNSSLYRALHVSRQRDARQSTFPQVKLAHLRSLPRPPFDETLWARLRELVQRASMSGADPDLKRAIDAAVFSLFGLNSSDAERVVEFLASRSPDLASCIQARPRHDSS
ncbi:MAG TPA: TaqI-like C-terminal specificity domain-containing protein [Polyangiaceae bacterium]|nr:TaqI-like C-terminal specificity domain-containing protein [Polyangiaceae bacterium]